MKLKRLFKDIADVTIKGSKEVEITGICAHSKFVAPGNLFIAKKGQNFDGTRFIPESIAAGAVAVVTDICDPFSNDVVQIIHKDIASIEAQIAAEFYQFPSNELKVIGITGTNGKTTTSYLVKHLLDHFGILTGLIGTVEWIVGKNHFPVSMTTPDVVTNQKLLREMVHNDCKAASMEVSSHALDQNRVENITFHIAVFTNITQDHLDYHGTMENYAAAKKRLFLSLKNESTAIFNIDDPLSDFLSKDCQGKKITYAVDRKADVYATKLLLGEKGSFFEVHAKEKSFKMHTSLIGKFNVYNLLAAISVGLCFNLSLEECIESLQNFETVRGRLERVKNSLGLNIFVDYAHTHDALENVLLALNAFKKGRVLTVFGCGGNRDRGKRKKMAAVAQKFSDISIVTSDNPRNEDPVDIVREILEGFTDRSKVIVELDRKQAIEKAIQMADEKDMILIAGKGHETYQIFSHHQIEFDDRKIASEICGRIVQRK